MADKQVQYFAQEEAGRLRCLVCPHHCRLQPGQTGICRVRSNQEGRLLAANYGEVSSSALDPIEKKPLYHFYPGSMILSAGSWGCNLACPFCQNHSIAHAIPATRYISPEELVEIGLTCRQEGSVGVAFTYNEPCMWLEYVMEAGPLLHRQGLRVVMVSNGYVEARPLKEMLAFVDAFNIDLKGFSADFYRRLCKGQLEPVQRTLEAITGQAHLEVTNLLIPGENDDEKEIRAMCRWLAELDPEVVLHFSRYHPAYKMKAPPTPAATLHRAAQIAREYLPFVYLGNLSAENNTACRQCGETLIQRSGYQVDRTGLRNGRCGRCEAEIGYIVGG